MPKLRFSGLPHDTHTWFETRTSYEPRQIQAGAIDTALVDRLGLRSHANVRKAQAGGFEVTAPFVAQEKVGGDPVVAQPGSEWPLDYVEQRFIDQHVASKVAEIVEDPKPASHAGPGATKKTDPGDE